MNQIIKQIIDLLIKLDNELPKPKSIQIEIPFPKESKQLTVKDVFGEV